MFQYHLLNTAYFQILEKIQKSIDNLYQNKQIKITRIKTNKYKK